MNKEERRKKNVDLTLGIEAQSFCTAWQETQKHKVVSKKKNKIEKKKPKKTKEINRTLCTK